MIQATITGRLGGDPESKTTKNGHAFCSFSVASNGRTGEATWVRCAVWRQQLVEFMLANARKGARVCVGGALELRKWGDGGDQQSLELDCSVVELFDWADEVSEAADEKASEEIRQALNEPYAPKRHAKLKAAQERQTQRKKQVNTDRAVSATAEEMPF